jgi:hypothetical protein
MYNSRLFKILIIVPVALTFLVGFEDKFSEKNQTGSPKIKKEVNTQVEAKTEVSDDEFDEEPLVLDDGPPSEDKKKFDIWYTQLEDNIRSKKSLNDKIESLQQGLAKIEKDKNRLQNLKFNEELEIDFLVKPLKLVPKVGQFKVEECHDYKMKMLSHFDPTSEEDPKDPSLKKALNVFKLICIN